MYVVCVFVCMYACMHVCFMYVGMYMYMYVCLYVCIYSTLQYNISVSFRSISFMQNDLDRSNHFIPFHSILFLTILIDRTRKWL